MFPAGSPPGGPAAAARPPARASPPPAPPAPPAGAALPAGGPRPGPPHHAPLLLLVSVAGRIAGMLLGVRGARLTGWPPERRANGGNRRGGGPALARPERGRGVEIGGQRVGGLLVVDAPANEIRPCLLWVALD